MTKTLLPVQLNLERLGSLQLAAARVKKRLQTRSVLSLTLTAERVDVALVRGTADSAIVPQLFAPVALGAEEIYRNPDRAGAALAAALEAAGLREKRCAIGVPPAWALTASSDLPSVSPEDLRGYLEIRAEREFSLPLSELRLGYSAYTLPDGTSRATLAALPAKRLDSIEKMLAASGRRAVSISLALDAVFSDEEPTQLHLLADGGHVDVVVTAGVLMAGRGVAALRTLPGPNGHKNGTDPVSAAALLEDAGTALAVPSAANGDGGAFNPTAFCREVRITLGRLPTAVQSQVRVAHFRGAPDAARQLCRETREGLGRMGIDVPPECLPDERPVPPVNAVRFLQRETVPFEFVVPVPNRWEQAFHRFNTPRGRKVAGVVLALILLPMLLFFVRSQQESSLTSEWAGMRNQVADLDILQQKIRKFRPWYDRTPTRLQLLEGLFGAFPDGGDVWAKSITIKGTTVTCTGFARNEEARQAMMNRLRARSDVSVLKTVQTRGSSPSIQFTFTYRWGTIHDR